MLVEFVGAAGVGKSYLVERLQSALEARGIAVTNSHQIQARSFDVASWLLLPRAMWLALSTRPNSRAAYKRAVTKIARYMSQRRTADRVGGVYLSSEGIFHKARGFHRRSRGLTMQQIVERLLRHIRPPDVLIAVEASAATVFSRRQQRAREGDSFTWSSVQHDVLLTDESVRTAMTVHESFDTMLGVLRLVVEDTDIGILVESTADYLAQCSTRSN